LTNGRLTPIFQVMDSVYHARLLEKVVLDAFDHFPIVVLLGARQVGKSTLVGHLFGNQLKTLVFDPVQDIGQARSDPDLFLKNNPAPLFLDEVQYAPELLSAIKRAVDLDGTVGRFVLSGSQNLALVKGVAESLAGRAAIIRLPPMSRAELARNIEDDFLGDWVRGKIPAVERNGNLKTIPAWYPAIWRGGYPKLITLPDRLVGTFFESYVTTVVERDIRTVAGVGDLQLFGRFFGLLGGLSGCEINAAQLGRDLGLDRKTALQWLSIAEATYQWLEIPAFTRNAIKRVSGRHKGYLTDSGLACWHQRIPTPDAIAGHPLQGSLIETWVVNEIIKRSRAWPVSPNFYHYRSHGGAEVDLILEWSGTLYPIEIKAKSHPRAEDGRGIEAFRNSFPHENIAPGLVVSAVDAPAWLTKTLYAVPWWRI